MSSCNKNPYLIGFLRLKYQYPLKKKGLVRNTIFSNFFLLWLWISSTLLCLLWVIQQAILATLNKKLTFFYISYLTPYRRNQISAHAGTDSCSETSNLSLFEQIVIVIKNFFLKFEAEGREFAKTVRTVKGQYNFG